MSRASPQELAMFAQVNANQPRMLEWLKAEREIALKFVVGGRDAILIHRYQGEVTCLDKIIDLLTNAGKYSTSKKP